MSAASATARLRAEGIAAPGLGPFDLEVSPGECLALRGASGAGKTRLLRALADLDPHEGAVRLDGVPCEAFPPTEWRRRVGLLPAHAPWWRDTVAEHFEAPPSPEALAGLGLDSGLVDAPVDRLSTGERQRFALLRVIANDPSVLLLDEPTGSLDAASAARVEAVITRLRARQGTAVIWVTHEAAQVGRVADREMLVGTPVRNGGAMP